MSNPPPLFRDQRNVDAEHLNLLAIFHFVAAGLALLGLGFLLVHYTLMSSIFSDQGQWKDHARHAPPPQGFLVFMRGFYVLGGVVLVLAGIGNVLSGFFIRGRRHRTFSIVVAGLNCLQVPLGTVLGVFTIVVLTRGSVRELYERNDWTSGKPRLNT